jgi:hypothetical protein
MKKTLLAMKDPHLVTNKTLLVSKEPLLVMEKRLSFDKKPLSASTVTLLLMNKALPPRPRRRSPCTTRSRRSS